MLEEIIECVPNFSCGRDPLALEEIIKPFRETPQVILLDYSQDKDHNRAVVTVIGSYEALKKAIVQAIGIASKVIDLRKHTGEHPRMGATDVVPFIPIRNTNMETCIKLSKEVAKEVAQKFAIPTFLYEESASAIHRTNLADVRKGQFEGFEEKMKDPMWKADFGPDKPHPSAGATAIGARKPLIAYNVNLNTSDLSIADHIAKRVRFIGGGLRCVKAIAVDLKERGIVQVSMNLTDYKKTSMYQAFEMVKLEARRYGVTIAGSELIGLAPIEAIADVAEYYLGIENFNHSQIIESKLLDEIL